MPPPSDRITQHFPCLLNTMEGRQITLRVFMGRPVGMCCEHHLPESCLDGGKCLQFSVIGTHTHTHTTKHTETDTDSGHGKHHLAGQTSRHSHPRTPLRAPFLSYHRRCRSPSQLMLRARKIHPTLSPSQRRPLLSMCPGVLFEVPLGVTGPCLP